MAIKERCDECAKYEKEGDNYCRICGFHLTEGDLQSPPAGTAYYTDEKYCAHCGGPKYKCSCVGKTSGKNKN